MPFNFTKKRIVKIMKTIASIATAKELFHNRPNIHNQI
jgi:hypothetical protein